MATATSTCSVEPCEQYVYSKNSGLCLKHYTRKRRGQPLINRVCIVDDCGTNLAPRNRTGYCQTHFHLSRYAKEYQHQWRQDNLQSSKIKGRARTKAWRQANPQKVKEHDQTRRARKKDAFVERVDNSSVWSRDSGLCMLCGFPANKDDWHLAHIIPLARGGEHSYMNTAVSHPECNQHQNDRLLAEFDIEMFLISQEKNLISEGMC